ncbi:hypothetical protein [Roseovarius sp. ZX-A-9]|uniref:hypothetical protein n=1 Tax=Roseovarius sp. ZX-A-9 TaxID=3014783 RepID=UPI00232D6DAC|nr:hypothetical protein [Roseovarius sp. ZX-A-9]
MKFRRTRVAGVMLMAALWAGLPANAQDRVSILLGSHHVNAPSSYEEFNPGAFLTWEQERFDWTVGGFRNSYGKGAVAAMVGMPIYERGVAQIALTGGLALYPGDGSRFDVHAGDVIPLAGVRARYGNAFMQVFPGDGSSMDAILSFGLSFGLKDADP